MDTQAVLRTPQQWACPQDLDLNPKAAASVALLAVARLDRR